MPLRILHLEDNPSDAELVRLKLQSAGFECEIRVAKAKDDFTAALEAEGVDLILSDYSLPVYNGLAALELARQRVAKIPFIFVSGTIGEEIAIESLKCGATDYVLKDRLERLIPVIHRAMSETEARAKQSMAEQQIREQAALLDQAQDAICTQDLDQIIRYWNRGAERLYGWNAGEILGRNANELLFQSGNAVPLEHIKCLLKEGFWQGEQHQLTKRGKTVIVESRWTLLRDPSGEPKSILIINTDVSEKRRIENLLLRTQRVESIGALAGGIAHDLNNSLAPILMAADLMRDELVTDHSKKMLQMITASANRSIDLVKQILAFARGAAGAYDTLLISTVIREVLRMAKDTFPRSIEIQSHVCPGLLPVAGNGTQVHQALLNLCINARDAMPNGGVLRIEAENFVLDAAEGHQRKQNPGIYVVLAVSDSGVGISEADQRKIFEPFFTTKEPHQGTGLGLSVVSNIVKSHGGFVEVSSRLGGGSTFRIYLPASNQTVTEPLQKGPQRWPIGSGQRILLVDDEAAILEATRLLLESLNYEVLTARNGVEAVDLFRKRCSEIELVITDLMMPHMNGLDAIIALRCIDPCVNIIALSGLGSEPALTKSTQSLVQAFIKKPFATEQLVFAVNRILGGKKLIDGLRAGFAEFPSNCDAVSSQ